VGALAYLLKNRGNYGEHKYNSTVVNGGWMCGRAWLGHCGLDRRCDRAKPKSLSCRIILVRIKLLGYTASLKTSL
jgi:hypothetical protein